MVFWISGRLREVVAHGGSTIVECAIFSKKFALTCEKRAHFLRGRRTKDEQTKWR